MIDVSIGDHWPDSTWQTYTTNNTSNNLLWTSYQDRYFYQIRCPHCKKLNFCELEKTVDCSKCDRTLRAVRNKATDVAIDE